ncbi:enoyl-CoA hydratase-related protein [Cupriavidus basilensis]|uniref:Enoyl-CoA hydratase-related protein n=1 Tax=Cupriavidus basilensis TaxID=68895 RepID=A0ABT6AKT6_9BURK|nr:enoyl-CoA hydratase-related protein [Cupriavidus basilensis]MDF3833226.1 enoyl-CoA hydratase-related protein [Cupriavidus basilensis]
MGETASGPVRCNVLAGEYSGVAVLTLDNPPLNVVFRGLTEALGRALDALAANASVRAVVVTGAGERAFCAGSDIAEFQPLMQPGRIGPEKLELQHRVFARLDDFPKPTVAAINGLAFGGGLEIAVCCDLIVADERARFALPEIKLGVFPGSGGPVRVTRRVGEGHAKEMMFLGEPIDAVTALAWGLVNRVVSQGTALDAALALAATLAQRPPLALALCKRAIDLAFDATEDVAIAAALPLSECVFTSAESKEGVRAFLAKETPSFPNALHTDSKD